MDTQALKAFLAAAQQQSFFACRRAAASDAIGDQQTHQNLEEQLGTSLFDRHNRTISLTETGERLLP